MDGISAIPQQPQLGRLAQFLRYLETQNAPEFLPRQLDVMGLVRQLALPQASTVENLSYGNSPFTMAPEGTGSLIPQVKTGRKAEVADLISMITGGVPGAKAVADVGTKLSNEAADVLVKAITRNPQATAPAVIQETSMPFMQAVAPKAPGLLEAPVKSDLGFYSALEQATIPLQNKGTGSQYLAQIEKTAGVKPEEIKWTGLDEFLKSKPTVTKQEVQDYLAANRVDVQEVRIEDKIKYPYKTADEWQNAIFRAERSGNWDEVNRLNDAWYTSEGVGNAGTTKFSQYTLPGGENYREILLTLPDANTARQAKIDAINKQYNAVLGGRAIADLPPAEKAVIDRLTAEHNAIADAPIGQDFRSSHFDQPNILAHMRVNDRVVDGKKTLFIEEVQSDWHQAGRKRGYRQSEEFKPMVYKPEDFQVSQTESQWVTTDARGQQRVVGKGTVGSEQEAKEYFARWLTGLEKEQAGRSTVERSSQVPDAPFKTTWHELALKRAIQEASEKGYDRIAFTTGKTQAERYDLSKQVDTIAYRPTGEGRFEISAIKDGNSVMTEYGKTVDDLEGLVGKDIAQKIANGEGSLAEGFRGEKGGVRELSGVDLKVGGEGMKGFYDQILPKSLEKLGKKFDAKVGKTFIEGERTRDASGIPSMYPEKIEVWKMDITPKMRESVLTKGQPLFQAAPLIPAGLLDYEE